MEIMTCNIVIPAFNLVEHTKLCIESIRKHTEYPYNIVAIDDNSSDDTYKYLSQQKDIKTIKNDSLQGWWATLNMGIKAKKADYYVFMDRDNIVTDGWLTKLVETFEKLNNVGMVSPTSNAGPENYGTQCLHARQDAQSLIHGYFHAKNPYDPHRIYWQIEKNQIQEFGRLVERRFHRKYTFQAPLFFFCVMISQNTLDKVGYIDEKYKIWHSDLEYCWKVIEAGLKPIVRRDTYIHHYKFPPLTEKEFRKAPYLRKYGTLRVEKDYKESLGTGQFIDSKVSHFANIDFVTFNDSPYRGRVLDQEGGEIP